MQHLELRLQAATAGSSSLVVYPNWAGVEVWLVTDEYKDAGHDDELTLSIPGGETAEDRGNGGLVIPATQPATVGGFRIIGKLGEGGMGVVWEAEQAQPRRRVALKVMRRDHVVDELHARMFRREAESLLLAAHEARRAAIGAADRRTLEVADQLARLYDAWGRPDQAAQYRPE